MAAIQRSLTQCLHPNLNTLITKQLWPDDSETKRKYISFEKITTKNGRKSSILETAKNEPD